MFGGLTFLKASSLTNHAWLYLVGSFQDKPVYFLSINNEVPAFVSRFYASGLITMF